MNFNYSKINLIPYFNTAWYVQLDDFLKFKLKGKLKINLQLRNYQD
jgi:hypothetical protein